MMNHPIDELLKEIANILSHGNVKDESSFTTSSSDRVHPSITVLSGKEKA
jgi:hypothetical protein